MANVAVLRMLVDAHPNALNEPVGVRDRQGRQPVPWIQGKKPIHLAIRSNVCSKNVHFLLSSGHYKEAAQKEKASHSKAVNTKRQQELEAVRAQERVKREAAEAALPEHMKVGRRSGVQEEYGDDVDGEKDKAPFYLNGDTLLHTAIEFNCPVDTLETILKLRPSALQEINNNRMLPIHYAAWRQCGPEVVQVRFHHFNIEEQFCIKIKS